MERNKNGVPVFSEEDVTNRTYNREQIIELLDETDEKCTYEHGEKYPSVNHSEGFDLGVIADIDEEVGSNFVSLIIETGYSIGKANDRAIWGV